MWLCRLDHISALKSIYFGRRLLMLDLWQKSMWPASHVPNPNRHRSNRRLTAVMSMVDWNTPSMIPFDPCIGGTIYNNSQGLLYVTLRAFYNCNLVSGLAKTFLWLQLHKDSDYMTGCIVICQFKSTHISLNLRLDNWSFCHQYYGFFG